MESKNYTIPALLIALGLAVSSIGGMYLFTDYKKGVGSMISATGSAELDLDSDLIVWRGSFNAVADTSKEAYAKIQNGEVADKDMWKYSSFWYKDFDDMAKKTMLRQIIGKWGIMSIEMQDAYTKDNSFVEVGNDNTFLTTPEEKSEALTPEITDVSEEVDLNELGD